MPTSKRQSGEGLAHLAHRHPDFHPEKQAPTARMLIPMRLGRRNPVSRPARAERCFAETAARQAQARTCSMVCSLHHHQ